MMSKRRAPKNGGEISVNSIQFLAQENFDLIAISALLARVLEAYQIADELRSAGQSVGLGGLHVSMPPCVVKAKTSDHNS